MVCWCDGVRGDGVIVYGVRGDGGWCDCVMVLGVMVRWCVGVMVLGVMGDGVIV